MTLDAGAAIEEHLAGDPGQAVRVLSHLYDRTGDAAFLEGCARVLERWVADPTRFNCLLWAIQRAIFVDRSIDDERVERIRWLLLAPSYLRAIDELVAAVDLPPPAGPGPPDRVLFVSHQILSPFHAPTKVCFDYAQGLARRGRQVLILNVNALPTRIDCGFFGAYVANVNPDLRGVQRLPLGDQEVVLHSSLPAGIERAKVDRLLRVGLGFRPGLVIAQGEVNLVADALSRWIPTICLPTSVRDPITRAHGIGDYTGRMGVPGVAARGLVGFRPAVRALSNATPIAEAGATYSRSRWSLDDDRFVFAVVGSRLADEIEPSFEATLARILDRCPRAALLIVGIETFAWNHPALERCSDRIRFVFREPDLRALFAACDAFLNPPRNGGGISAAIALAEALPILTLGGGDVAAVVGEAHALPDRKAMIEAAVGLVEEEAERDRWRRRMAEALAARPTFEQVLDDVLTLGDEARRVFESA